jgi:hypothetical protein
MMDKNDGSRQDADPPSLSVRGAMEGRFVSKDGFTVPSGKPSQSEVDASEHPLRAALSSASSHCGQDDRVGGADATPSTTLESNLAWAAMRFVLGELSDDERAGFERQLDDSQAARDALVEASLLVDCLQAAMSDPDSSGRAIVPQERTSLEQASHLGERQSNSGPMATTVETTRTKVELEARQTLQQGACCTSRERVTSDLSSSAGTAARTGTRPAADRSLGPHHTVRLAKFHKATEPEQTGRRARWFRAVSLVTVLLLLIGAFGVLISSKPWFANGNANLMQELQPRRLGNRDHELAKSPDTVQGSTSDARELAYHWMETQQSWAGSDPSSDLLGPATGGEEDWSEPTDHTLEDSVESIEAPSWMLAALQHRTTQGGEE